MTIAVAAGLIAKFVPSEESPPPVEIESSDGTIVKNADDSSPFTVTLDSTPSSAYVDSVAYIANGYVHTADSEDRRYGESEIRFFNPSPRPATFRIKLFFANKEPVELDAIDLGPLSNSLLVKFPQISPGLFEGSDAWGAEIRSNVPLVMDHISAMGIEGPPDNQRFDGGIADLLAVAAPSRLWYFSDGLKLDFEPDSAPTPFDESEWYHVLNPGTTDADVTMHCFYDEDDYESFTFRVKAERVRIIDNEELVKKNQGFGLKFTSTQPIVVQSERFIFGLNSKDEWGMHIHMARPGVAPSFPVEAGSDPDR